MLSGLQIGEFREQDETIKVILREPSSTRNLLSALDTVYVKTTDGASVPLRQVANVRLMLELASNGAEIGCRLLPFAARCQMM
jgi:multidrug efflux pump